MTSTLPETARASRPGSSAAGGTTYPVTLTTTDGARIEVECGEDADVLAAAAEAGYVLPSLCRTGTCGACCADVDGDHELGPHSTAALPDADRERGAALLCCTYPREPLAVTLRCEDGRIIRGAIPERAATVVAVEPVSPDGRTVRVRLQLAEDCVSGAGAEFEPGQFVEVALPGQDPRRAYSLANVANWDGEVELLVRLQPGGWFSSWLEARLASPSRGVGGVGGVGGAGGVGEVGGIGEVGEQVVVHGPQGAFGLRENGLRPRWFVAGGTGLAPLLSMLRRMAEWGDPQPVRLYLGVNTEAELPALPELDEAVAQLPGGAQVRPCVWRPGSAWSGFCGTPADALAVDLAAIASAGGEWPDVYVCGPPAMVDAVAQVAAEAGLPAGQLVVERFLPA